MRNRSPLVKCFASRFDCPRFTSVILRNLDIDKYGQNLCRVMKAQHGRTIFRIPYFTITLPLSHRMDLVELYVNKFWQELNGTNVTHR